MKNQRDRGIGPAGGGGVSFTPTTDFSRSVSQFAHRVSS